MQRFRLKATNLRELLQRRNQCATVVGSCSIAVMLMTPVTDVAAEAYPEATPAIAANTDVASEATASTVCALLASTSIFHCNKSNESLNLR